MPQKSTRRLAIELFIASFAVLFQELALIRWLPGQVRVLAYFPNLILISSFLGLGIGCLRAQRSSLLWLWPVGLLGVLGAGWAASQVAITQESVSEHLWLLYFDLPEDAPVIHGVRLPIVIAFLLAAVSFIPLGQIIAERLQAFQEQSGTLWGYCWDLTGSIVGVLAFALSGYLGLFPVAWFTICVGAMLVFVLPSPRWRIPGIVAAIGILLIVGAAEKASFYSPYYAIDTRSRGDDPGIAVMTNGSYHQVALSLAQADPGESRGHERARRGYHSPYRFLPKAPERALVLGAGTGNDVAVLLDEGAAHVDAVEIDPVILDLGREHHPNRPYDDPRVTVHNTDARSFLNNTSHTYDLIVFGTLDSMTRLSALSNVRLDNFVYTQDGLKSARSRLKEDGGLLMYYMVGHNTFIDARITRMLTNVFDGSPKVLRCAFQTFRPICGNNGHFDVVWMAGAAFDPAQPPGQELSQYLLEDVGADLELPTDDWPYLYLQERGVSSFYLSLMVIFLLIALGSVFLASPELRAGFRSGRGIDAEMFLFGLAFLLIETKAVTEMNLVWGATWLTSAVVFGSILLMVLLGTIVMQVRPLPWWLGLSGLVITLIVGYITPTSTMVGLDLGPRLALSILFVGAPIFFASLCFALRFKQRQRPDIAFGWNLLGAVCGGLLELVSMAIGIKALFLVALGAYLGVALLRERAVRQPAQVTP